MGLGLGGYAFFDTTVKPMVGLAEPTLEDKHILLCSNRIIIQHTTGFENVTGSGLSIIVTQNSSLYVCFNCYVFHSGSYMTEVRLYINDVAVTNYMRVSTNDASRTPMTLQYFDDVVEPGTYILTIEGYNGDACGFYTTVSLYAEIISPV